MKLSEIYELANSIAPKALSDEYCREYGAYDNSGVLVDAGEEIKGAVFSLDLSYAAIDEAIARNANLLMIHHPAIYGKISEIKADDPTLLGGKLVKCLKNGISVVAMHLNLDGAEGGIDETLAQGICASAGGTLKGAELMHALSQGGYGRAYEINETPFEVLAENMKKTFSCSRMLSYGDGERKIRRVASFCGAGADEENILFAKQQGADAIVSADFKHHLIALARELGLCVIALTHYASEQYGFEKYYQKIRQRVEIPCALHVDNDLL